MKAVAACSSASFAVFGAFLTLPGALLPLLVEQFGIRLVEAGSMLAFQWAAYLVAVLGAGRLLEHLTARLVLSASMLMMATGIAAFGLVSSWLGGALTLFVGGLGMGVMEVAANTLLIDVGGERRSNLLNFSHLFFGVGSFVAPALSTHAVAAGWSWRLPFFAVGALTAVVAVAWHAVPGTDRRADSRPSDQTAATRVDRRLVVVLAALLGVYVGVETGVGTWLTKYLVSVRGFALDQAGNVLSLYWLALAVARLVLSVLAHRVREETVITWLAFGTCVALALALAADATRTAVLGFVLTGAALSGIFPAVIALGGRQHPHRAARVTAALIAGAGVGGIVIPWLMSAVADAAGLVVGMGFYVVVAAGMLGLALAVQSMLPRSPSAAQRRVRHPSTGLS